MSQAEKPNTMSFLSRRSALAAAPAAAAAALAAGTAANSLAMAVAIPSAGDAELLALRDQFVPLFEEWRFGTITEFTDADKIEEAIAVRLGRGPNLDDDGEVDIGDKAYWEARSEVLDDDDDEGAMPEGFWDDLHDKLYVFAGEIFSHRAATREGLALQLQAFLTISGNRIFEDTDDRGSVYKLAMCVLTFTGAPFPIELITTCHGEPLKVAVQP